MKAQKETKWVCIQLACSRRPRALEEAHCSNIQAKFYNEKFPLAYESDEMRDSLSWRSWCYFEAQVWKKRIVVLPLFIFFGGPSIFSWPFSFFGTILYEWWSSHFYLFTTQWLQLDTRKKYDSIWMPPVVYRDMQWIKSDMYENYEGGLATKYNVNYMIMQRAIWQK